MDAPELLDAIGVPLWPGQRVVYATAGIHATGFLTPGTITRVSVVEKREGVGAQRTQHQPAGTSEGQRLNGAFEVGTLVIVDKRLVPLNGGA
jgi:hypothetical protein